MERLDINDKIVLETLYKYKDEEITGRDKGHMFANEIGTTKRIVPYKLHYNKVNRIIKKLGILYNGLGLINDNYKVERKNIFYLAEKGLLFKEYEVWKLNQSIS